MKLIIVESPSKAKTISHFLKNSEEKYEVVASLGHIRDLPKSELGIDIEHNFTPRYVIPPRARKIINQLKKKSAEAEKVILATDEDREGEAIAYHLSVLLNLKIEEPTRLVFHEITEPAIKKALLSPRTLDLNLVNAQVARRILDRLVGYELSPFLWKKIARGLSAGRVQSPALRLIVEREKEIQNFQPQEYFEIWSKFKKIETKETFKAKLIGIDDKILDRLAIKTSLEAEQIKNDLSAEAEIINLETKETKRNPFPPFKTSTLAQAAFQRLRFPVKKTMMIAQRLYEGIDLGSGPVGLITYMRTDSFNLSEEALQMAQSFLKEKLGPRYALDAPRRFKTKVKIAQEAHEAIRPTNPFLEPDQIKKYLSLDEYKLYDLIWRRFLASQMPAALIATTNVHLKNISKNKDKFYLFSATGSQIKFDGFLKLWPTVEYESLPNLELNEKLKLTATEISSHTTKPPPRYNDASLIKTLEAYGIGRPSTYAPIINLILERNYVSRDQNRSFYPTEMGFLVCQTLIDHFPEIIDYQFTAKMEEDLDEIAEGKIQWQKVVADFYFPFKNHLERKYEEVKKEDLVPEQETNEICELCGRKMVVKMGRYGRFLACSGFPECKNTKPLNNNHLNIKCPKCHEGYLVIRRTKKGKTFYGCSRWPECDYLLNDEPIDQYCPLCGEILVKKKNKIKCSNKNCSYESNLEKIDFFD